MKKELRARNFKPSRARGQNFLFEHRILDTIAGEAGIDSGDVVLEIGCGCGFLTMHLAPLAGKVLAVEIDAALSAVAETFLAPFTNVQVVTTDFLDKNTVSQTVDQSLQETGTCQVVVGNLPYSRATAIIASLPAWSHRPRKCLFMVQEEVAQRLAARPGARDYGSLSVLTEVSFEVERGRRIGPEAFWPKPAVYSRLVRLAPRTTDIDLVRFSDFVRALFAQPRRTAVNSFLEGASRLRILTPKCHRHELRNKLTDAVSSLHLSPDVRPGKIDVSQILTMFHELVPETFD